MKKSKKRKYRKLCFFYEKWEDIIGTLHYCHHLEKNSILCNGPSKCGKLYQLIKNKK